MDSESSSAKWYVVSVYSGLENSVVKAIKAKAAEKNLLDSFVEFLVPSEQTVEVRRGKKVTRDRNYFPGYILIKAFMSDEVWSLVCGLARVNGFLGARKPLPISEAEVERIFNQMKESQEKPRNIISFEVGEVVRVIEGPFSSFTGTIDEIDEARQRLVLSITIFGRPTPLELEFDQVEKS